MLLKSVKKLDFNVLNFVNLTKLTKLLLKIKVETEEDLIREINEVNIEEFLDVTQIQKKYVAWIYKDQEKDKLCLRFKGYSLTFDVIDLLLIAFSMGSIKELISFYEKLKKVKLKKVEKEDIIMHNTNIITNDENLTENQKKILLYLNNDLSNKAILKNGSLYTGASYRYLSNKIKIPFTTINYNIKKLKNQGYIETLPYKNKRFQYKQISFYKIKKLKKQKNKDIQNFIYEELKTKGYIALSNYSYKGLEKELDNLVKNKTLLYVKPNKRLKKKFKLKTDEYIYIKNPFL